MDDMNKDDMSKKKILILSGCRDFVNDGMPE